MKATINKLKGAIKPPIQNVARKIFRMDPGYAFIPSSCIEQQSMAFRFANQPLSITSDFTTPLYDTVAEIAGHDCYQLDQIDFTDSADSLVLDVGAHIGTATLVFSRLHRGKILCFEPIPDNCRWLKANLEANHVNNAVIVPAAVTDRDGFAEFDVDPTSSVAGRATGIMATDPRVFSRSLKVKSVTLRTALADYHNQRIHLIKMDCEGGEYGIVEQLTPDLLARIRYLTFEVHDLDRTHNVKRLMARLQGLGFRVLYKTEMHNRFALHHLLATRTPTETSAARHLAGNSCRSAASPASGGSICPKECRLRLAQRGVAGKEPPTEAFYVGAVNISQRVLA